MIKTTTYFNTLNVLINALSIGEFSINDYMYITRDKSSKKILTISHKDCNEHKLEMITVAILFIELRINQYKF